MDDREVPVRRQEQVGKDAPDVQDESEEAVQLAEGVAELPTFAIKRIRR